MKVECTRQPTKSQQVEPTPASISFKQSNGQSKQIEKPPEMLTYDKLTGNLASITELLQT